MDRRLESYTQYNEVNKRKVQGDKKPTNTIGVCIYIYIYLDIYLSVGCLFKKMDDYSPATFDYDALVVSWLKLFLKISQKS